jgi:hypothetical protein
MGVKLVHALGAEVTVLSQTLSKLEDGMKLGADHFHATSDRATFKTLRGHFDLIVNTVSAPLPIDRYLSPRPAVAGRDRSAMNAIGDAGLECTSASARVGWPGASQPPAPTDPGVTVSRHRALLIGPNTSAPSASGRTGRAVSRAVRPATGHSAFGCAAVCIFCPRFRCQGRSRTRVGARVVPVPEVVAVAAVQGARYDRVASPDDASAQGVAEVSEPRLSERRPKIPSNEAWA